MTGYTSGKISHDPRPWKLSLNNSTTYRTAERERLDYDYAPRPEYDNHNPILVEYRKYDERNAKVFRTWANTMGQWSWDRFDFTPTPEHIAHARRVLAKLAALTTTPNGVTD